MAALSRFFCILLLALSVTTAPAFAQLQPVPKLATRVTDQAGMLDAAQRQRLEAVLADYEAKTGSQIAVLLVNSTEPEAIEQYSIRVTDAWQLGRKGVDDGVLLLVARDNPSSLRRLRIEAGRGVQGVLTDAQSKRILQDVIAPHFRQEHYYEGLVAGVGAIATLLNQEAFPAPPAQQQQRQAASDGGFPLWAIFLVIIGASMLRSVFRPRRGRTIGTRRGQSHWGSATTGFVLGNIIGNMSRGGGGGFGSSGGGFGGGGFSGGGGGFDGGGASGDW
ncbi:TPM domain-containing protein [Massilia timonae]|uniref:TPM domain-containing protein n=2 Tax=Massilia timonae TaxID=47229 RepID=UPI0023578021|nr:TPM domain-containing protein [Massilia timonae]